MEVTFIGGAGTVTGSKTLVESNGMKILIDCGLFQGIKPLRELNWQPLPFLASTIDYVLLTHGHLDHCGWLPRLVAQGFKGKIYCSAPTKEIAELVLLDSAKIQEEEADKANKGNYSKHEVAEPLYTSEQAKRVLPMFRVAKPNDAVALDAEISAVFRRAGHILGACSIELTLENKVLVFSGDVGRDDDVLMYPPVKPKKADYLFIESTYGDRIHPDTDAREELVQYIHDANKRGGTVIIPSFAVERAQSIMYILWQLKKEGKIPDIPYILDTPMGISAFDIFASNLSWHKLKPEECAAVNKMFTKVHDYQETMNTVLDKGSKVVIAASGMATGGRVLEYFKHYIGLPQTSIIIVGYQAEGTRGRKLLEGEEEIKIQGKYFPVRANILEIQGLSAHGDQEDLINWFSELENKPEKIFIVHGENKPADVLRIKLKEKYGFDCSVPLIGQKFTL